MELGSSHRVGSEHGAGIGRRPLEIEPDDVHLEEEACPETCPVQDERLPRRAGGLRERDAGDLARRRRARMSQKERHCEQPCEEGPHGWLRLTALWRRITALSAGGPSSRRGEAEWPNTSTAS